MDKGTYILLIENNACLLSVGSLGLIRFRPGWHVYVGSALGPGGFTRVNRHIRINQEKEKKPRWHIDYLLLSSWFTIKTVYGITLSQRLECFLARQMEGEVIPGFGSSDCACDGHLFFFSAHPDNKIVHLLQTVVQEHDERQIWCMTPVKGEQGGMEYL